jgi:hypothetical protein
MRSFRGLPHRRDVLQVAGLTCAAWLTPLGRLLAREADRPGRRDLAQSVILLWMAGAPSQLETFDPHPDPTSKIAGGTRSIATAVKGVRLAAGFERLAAEMESVTLVRSLTSKEGDHERGTYTVKTGHLPDPTVVHPSIGAVCCHELQDKVDIPRHISILPNQWPGRGGYLGDEYDAFKIEDPAHKIPDLAARVPADRDARRVADLDVVERAFARGREARVKETLHRETVQRARVMMSSEQLQAFDVKQEPAAVLKEYGDTPFGRGCLAARRLIEVGVRCVEVTLDGWDTHVNNHELQAKRVAILDPALAALVRDLRERKLLERTVVLCLGEFGRTPTINPLGGRDHWPNGFSMAIAGGRFQRGFVLGQTDPDGKEKPTDAVTVQDVHATVLHSLGIDPHKVMASPIGRTVKLSEGSVVPALLA